MQANANKFFNEIQSSDSNPAWLGSLRKDASERFLALGFPKRSHEDWLYTSSKSLDFPYQTSSKDTDLHKAAIEHYLVAGAWHLVFVDGQFSPKDSHVPQESELQLHILDKNFRSELKGGIGRVSRTLNWGSNSLEDFNLACFQTGFHLSTKTDLKLPIVIQILHVSSDQTEKLAIMPRILIDLAPHSELTLLETFVGEDRGNWTNASLDIQMAPYAKLNMAQEKFLGTASLLTQRTYFSLAEGAELNYFQVSMGGQLNRNELYAELSGPLAKARLDGLSLGKDTAHLDQNTTVLHKAANTKSEQLYKALLNDESRSVFNGKIEIARNAQQVEAQQLSKALLLNEKASANTKPQLLIDADDVRCSHGATVGQLNAQEIFYLQSRGIPRAEAESILAKAFIRDVLSRVSSESLQTHLSQSLTQHANLEI